MKALLPIPLALSLVCGALLPTAGHAQCPGPATAQLTRYGTTCDFFFQSSALTANYDPTTCTLNMAFGASPTCCNTYLAGQFLLFGTQSLGPGVSFPPLAQGCELSVLPLFVLPTNSKPGSQVPIPVPAIQGTVFVQGMNDYFTTIGLTHDFQTTNGIQIDFR